MIGGCLLHFVFCIIDHNDDLQNSSSTDWITSFFLEKFVCRQWRHTEWSLNHDLVLGPSKHIWIYSWCLQNLYDHLRLYKNDSHSTLWHNLFFLYAKNISISYSLSTAYINVLQKLLVRFTLSFCELICLLILKDLRQNFFFFLNKLLNAGWTYLVYAVMITWMQSQMYISEDKLEWVLNHRLIFYFLMTFSSESFTRILFL